MSKKLTSEVLAEENEKILDAYTNKDGKIYIKETYTTAEGGMHYIISKDLKLIRLISKFAQNLIDAGKAIIIRRDEWDAFKNSVQRKSY